MDDRIYVQALTILGMIGWFATIFYRQKQRTATAVTALWLIAKMPSDAKMIALHTLETLGERTEDRGPIP